MRNNKLVFLMRNNKLFFLITKLLTVQRGSPSVPILAQIYQVPKTQGHGICTLEILMSDYQLSYLYAYFQGIFNCHDVFGIYIHQRNEFDQIGKCSERSEMDFYINLMLSDNKISFLPSWSQKWKKHKQ